MVALTIRSGGKSTITAPLEQTEGPVCQTELLDHGQRAVPGATGGQHHRDAGVGHRPDGGADLGRQRPVVVENGAVDVEGDDPGSPPVARRAHTGDSWVRPPRKGCSAAGSRTEPSACWWFSSSMTIIRGIAHRVPFSVATGATPVS